MIKVSKIAPKNLTPELIAERVRDGAPFESRSMSGIPGKTSYTGELSQGLAKSYEATQGVRYTILSYETPIAWVTGSSWHIPGELYSVTTAQHLVLARQAAGMDS
jgi:hypothetical protein